MKALQHGSLRFALLVLIALACGFLMTGCALLRSFAYGTESCGNPHPGHTVICIDNELKATPDPAHTPADQEVHWFVRGNKQNFDITFNKGDDFFDKHCDNTPHCSAKARSNAPHNKPLKYSILRADGKTVDPVIIIDDTLVNPGP